MIAGRDKGTLVSQAVTQAAETNGHKTVSPWQDAFSWCTLIGVTALSLVTDLWSKYAAFAHVAGEAVTFTREEAITNLREIIPPHAPVVVLPKLLEFTLVLNPGAVFGIGAGKRAFFIGVTIAAVIFGVWVFGKWTRKGEHAAHAALGLLLGGGLGNLYDRVFYGCVRDFIHPLPGVKWPFGWNSPWSGREVWGYVSNVADLYLLIGIAMLLFFAWRTPRAHAEPKSA